MRSLFAKGMTKNGITHFFHQKERQIIINKNKNKTKKTPKEMFKITSVNKKKMPRMLLEFINDISN